MLCSAGSRCRLRCRRMSGTAWIMMTSRQCMSGGQIISAGMESNCRTPGLSLNHIVMRPSMNIMMCAAAAKIFLGCCSRLAACRRSLPDSLTQTGHRRYRQLRYQDPMRIRRPEQPSGLAAAPAVLFGAYVVNEDFAMAIPKNLRMPWCERKGLC